MDAITLYGTLDSGNCLKPKWVAERLGVRVNWIETSAFDGSTRKADYLALNPAGQVPVAVLSDGRTLAQSSAIMVFLAEGSPLIPKDAYARAKMFEWMFWEQYSHEPYVAVRIARLFFLKKREDELDPALLTRGNAALARLDLQLKETPYLVGEALSLADIACVAYTRVAHRGGFDLSGYPALLAWVKRVESDLGLPDARLADQRS
jgi:glutathione S-transferase